MGKMKIYELAKELNISNKEIIAFLAENGVEGKSHASAIEDDAITIVKKKFGAAPASAVKEAVKAVTADSQKEAPVKATEMPVAEAAPKADASKSAAEATKEALAKPASEQPKEQANAQESPKKKKRIVIVGNPQNSKSGMNMPKSKPQERPMDRQQDRKPERQQQNNKSDISAEQVAAKFKAILGEGKSTNKPQPAPTPAPAPEPAPSVSKPVFKPEINTEVRQAGPVVISRAEAPKKEAEVERKTETVTEKQAPAANAAAPKQANAAEARVDNRQPAAATERKPENRTEQRFDNRSENRGENRQSGYGDRRNDSRGENRGDNRQGGYGDRRNDSRGENRGDGRTDNRQGGYGDRRNDGRGENRGDGRTDNRQGGYGDRRNDNRGDNRQGGFGDRRSDSRGDNRGENRQGGFGERRFENRGDGRTDNRQGGFGDRRNDGRGDNRTDKRQGGYDRQGGYGDKAVFDKDADEARQTRPGQGAKKQGSQNRNSGFGDVAPAKDNKRDERRTSGKEKERNKKDFIYEDEDQNIKGKSGNKAGKFIKPEKKVEVMEEQIKVIQLSDVTTIKDLADKMKMQPSVIIKKLFMQGKIVTVNHELSYEEAEEIAMEYDILCEKEVMVDVIEELLKEEEEGEEVLVKRPPVICVMGHVDHGKTSLLDAIRKTHVTDREAGGITQHIGAYTVTTQSGERVTFLDTPGHEAFTAMRMRGANATDIAILVVAADDGVMPQTVEAINHAKAAGIEIIVAINKIDKPAANIERVKQELTEYELVAEDWGGSTVFCPVSAKTGEGIEDLLEMILLTADVLELKANPKRQARGLVIEAQLDKGRGPVATVLVQKGTLHVGDFISAGACYGKVRAMIDDKGRRVKEADPSTPVEILGLSDVPEAGEVFLSHDSDRTAKTYAETYMAEYKARMLEETKKRMSLDDLFGKIQEGNLKELNIIVKADVQGSVEAVKQSLSKLSNDEVVVKCIHGGVGLINESDVVLASASNAIIIGFNSRPDATAKNTAEREGVEIKLYRVIYQAIEDIEKAMKGMLDPIYEEKVLGHAEVRQIFRASSVGNIAGSYVMDGVFQRGCKVRISREGVQIFEGELASLKRFKDDVKEVRSGFECGLVFEGFDQMQELDIVEAYTMVEVPR